MKTYQSPTKDKKTKKNFFMRNIYGIIFGITLLVVAGVITLTLVLTNRTPVDNNNGGSVDVDTPPAGPVYVVPVENYTVGKSASLTKLVYSTTLNQWRTHNGVDILTSAGAQVKTICGGTVKSVKETNLEGFVVTVEHDGGITSTYKGLGEVSVKEGDKLEANQAIGTVAENMMIEQNDGAHLHLEMTKDGKLIDPASLISDLSSDK
ncbi:MAG: M23 family metallopeptidase [Clostridia bacterium]|nr:M23 family metallopeptidase [Clostridia bacterium]